jgi:hypothetical protein
VATPSGIASGEALGTPAVGLTLLVTVAGIGTLEAFGAPTLIANAHHQIITTTLPGRGRYAVGTPVINPASLGSSGDIATLDLGDRTSSNTPRNRGAS